ncbi:hypothetical protein H2200_012875 [Cladophialophora chaetospira]|uniref:non-specific serine/threonine protein kinase n=1 Tax=Cladophialophora chaetospira TaxID=386627 RepID=A0AA38WWY4_9EURO|nr:hypothetical protein H2200_012875 [Cladophialophora chaetospira]
MAERIEDGRVVVPAGLHPSETATTPPSASTSSEPTHSENERILTCVNDVEEGQRSYRPGGFHPVRIGDVYAKRYQVLLKLGFGRYSTVWLVQDLQAETEQYRALKILSAECHEPGVRFWEREILHRLREGDQSDPGYDFICHLLDDFEHVGPNGVHYCFVFDAAAYDLQTYQSWFPEKRVPTWRMKAITAQLLLALNYAHLQGVIHTDIKPRNILVKLDDPDLIKKRLGARSLYTEEQLLRMRLLTESLHHLPAYACWRGEMLEIENSMNVAEGRARQTPALATDERVHNAESKISKVLEPSKELPGTYTIVETADFYGLYDDPHVYDDVQISLGDWGAASWVDRHLTKLIQPVTLRAPEVLIEAEWDYTTDLWNLGAVIFEVFRNVRLFNGERTPSFRSGYDLQEHLRQIIDVFGPFPRQFLEQGSPNVVGELFNAEGTVWDVLGEIGPRVKRNPLETIGYEFWSDVTETDLLQFTRFLKAMMKINPTERASIGKLVEEDWLSGLLG